MREPTQTAIGTTAPTQNDQAAKADSDLIEFDDLASVAPDMAQTPSVPSTPDVAAEPYAEEIELTSEQMELTVDEIDTLLDMRRKK